MADRFQKKLVIVATKKKVHIPTVEAFRLGGILCEKNISCGVHESGPIVGCHQAQYKNKVANTPLNMGKGKHVGNNIGRLWNG